jgi:hypothetical protein
MTQKTNPPMTTEDLEYFRRTYPSSTNYVVGRLLDEIERLRAEASTVLTWDRIVERLRAQENKGQIAVDTE